MRLAPDQARQDNAWSLGESVRDAHACSLLGAGHGEEGAPFRKRKKLGVQATAAETRDSFPPCTGGRNVACSPAALYSSIGSGTDAACAGMTREDREVAALTLSSYDDAFLRCASVSAWLDRLLDDQNAADCRVAPDSNVAQSTASHAQLSQQTATFINAWCRAPHRSSFEEA